MKYLLYLLRSWLARKCSYEIIDVLLLFTKKIITPAFSYWQIFSNYFIKSNVFKVIRQKGEFK